MYREDGSLALDREQFPRPSTTREGLAQLAPSFAAIADVPVPAAKVLARAGLTIDDSDLFEINEAFAVVAEKFIRDLDLDRDKVNVDGGAMALGHPIAATGAMLMGTVLDELERTGGGYGLVTMGAAGGHGRARPTAGPWRCGVVLRGR